MQDSKECPYCQHVTLGNTSELCFYIIFSSISKGFWISYILGMVRGLQVFVHFLARFPF